MSDSRTEQTKGDISVNFMATSELSMNANLAKLLKAAECGLIQSGTRFESEDSEHFSRINLWSRSANGNKKEPLIHSLMVLSAK
jgi:hypothetical protein